MVRVSDAESFQLARRLAREEGLLVGGSAGTAAAAALKYAWRLPPGKVVVVLLPDSGRNYLSKIFSDRWMEENGFLGGGQKRATVAQVLRAKRAMPGLISAESSDKAMQAVLLMERYDISQLPVTDHGRLVGSLSDLTFAKLLHDGADLNDQMVADVMGKPFPQVEESTDISEPYRLLLAGTPRHCSDQGRDYHGLPLSHRPGRFLDPGKPDPEERGVKFATQAIHAGQGSDPATGATIVPVYLTSTFTQSQIGVNKGYEYSRTGNPTRAALETCLAALEEGKHGLAFASGSAATAAVASILRPGDHVVSAEDVYGGTYRYFERVLRPVGVKVTYVDGRSAGAFASALLPRTRLVWVETPTNPLLHLTDIRAVAEVCRTHGAALAVDNTFATPFLQRPLTLGASVVVHSTTKYIGGHSDVVGGAVITSSEALHEAFRFYQNAAGAVPGPLDAWLTLRGVKTLAVRMHQHQRNALQVAGFLTRHPRVRHVRYPGLPCHGQHELARRQMSGFGGMVSFEIDGGRREADAFFRRLRVFSLAESLGGVESLACYPAAMTHASIPAKERQRRGITEGLIRLSVGIEDAEDLIDDLDRALKAHRSRRGTRERVKPAPAPAIESHRGSL